MSTPTASWGSSISHHLRATKGILQCIIFDAKYVWSGESCHIGGLKFEFTGSRRAQERLRLVQRMKRARGLRLTHVTYQFDVLEQDALDVLQLIRSWRNRLAPINKVPPEILTLVPDFLDGNDGKDEGVIALTHVCRAWREAFTTRSSLWTDLYCVDPDKSEVYLERSKPVPINLSLYRRDGLSPHDPFFQIIPRAIRRLKSLSVEGTPRNLQDITVHLSHPAPLLEELSIHGGCENAPHRNPVLTSTLFNGDLSSLRTLRLEHVRTEFPWRNMINLTSFVLTHTAPGEVSVKQLLDFFDSAPNLRRIDLYSATPTHGTQTGHLVSLPCLKWLYTTGGNSSSLLLDHLLVPVGAHLTTEVELPIKGPPFRFLDNLRNLRNFTMVRLYGDEPYPHIELNGPNGEVRLTLRTSQVNTTQVVLGSLVHFDTSMTERLEIISGSPLSSDPLYHALLPMNDLRTLTLHRCRRPQIFVHALHPNMRSSLADVACPKLEELVINLNMDEEEFDVQDVIGTMEARASRGTKLRTVRIVDGRAKPTVDLEGVLELRKHAWHVEYGPRAGRFWYNDRED